MKQRVASPWALSSVAAFRDRSQEIREVAIRARWRCFDHRGDRDPAVPSPPLARLREEIRGRS
jgi:hypothetical protein